MMKIQKGIVKYKDRSDIVCTYGITEDGKQYYFLGGEDKPLNNGYRIASTALVEAIDPMVKASNVGLIDAEGREIIPFDNKSIKLINDDIILVEKAQPISESVLKAISLKNDPAEATKLVSTPATIKGKLNAKMGPDGRYFFNDQFSEATVCDINGNNLVDDEYFSFIGMANGKLYFSKNTEDSEITEYSVLPPEVQSDVTPNNDTNEIDVSKIAVSADVVENALNNEALSDTVVQNEGRIEESQEDSMQSGEVSSESIDAAQTIPVVDESDEVVDDGSKEIEGKEADDDFDIKIDGDSDLVDEVANENENDLTADSFEISEDEIADSDTALESTIESEEDASEEEFNVGENHEENSLGDSDLNGENSQEENDLVAFANSGVLPNEASKEETDVEESSEEEIGIPEENPSETEDEENEEENFEDEVAESVFKDSILKADTLIKSEDNFEENFEDTEENDVVNDNIMTDVANSMNSLINLNKKQKEIISQYRDKLDKMNLTKRSMEIKLTTLESKNKALEEKLHEQEKVIASQAKELDEIRPQLAGKDELVKLLADAQVLLGQDTYDDNVLYAKKVA